MDAAFLIVTYIVTTMIFQTIGFAISRGVDYQLPGVAGLFHILAYVHRFFSSRLAGCGASFRQIVG
jgi:hypothetical protein